MNPDNDYNVFVNLVKEQFTYGGQKYSHSKEKEATDVLFDIYGKNWLFGTIDKYTFRFKTCKREKDLLKIACYQYITWLKRGFHIDDKREVPINTNVETKLEQFNCFISRIKNYNEFNKVKINVVSDYPGETPYENVYDDETLREGISDALTVCGNSEWKNIEEYQLTLIFKRCYALWLRNFKDKAGQDTDTYNEGK